MKYLEENPEFSQIIEEKVKAELQINNGAFNSPSDDDSEETINEDS